MLRRKKTGQSTAEYAIVIGLVIAAAVAMQVYVKRGIQGKMKDAADYTDPSAKGKYGVSGTLDQYEPDYTTMADTVSKKEGTERTKVSKGGVIEKTIEGIETSSRKGSQTILAP